MVDGGGDRRSKCGQASVGRGGPALKVLLVGVGSQAWLFRDFRVIQSNRVAEAIKILCETEVAAIVVDLELPDSSGLSTVQRLRAVAGSVPIVVLVGDGAGDAEIAHQALGEGAAAYLLRTASDSSVLEPVVRSAIVRGSHTAEAVERTERLDLAVRGSGDGLWDWDLGTDLVYFSEHSSGILGLGQAETTGAPDLWFGRIHPDDLAFVEARLRAHIEGSSSAFQCEHRVLNGFGEPRWVLARGKAVRCLEGKASRITGFLTDVTTRRRSEEEAVRRSLHDGLTGLANRALFMDRISHCLGALKRKDGMPFAVLFLDLDHFKHVNDVHGHAGGDDVLREVSERLETVLRAGDSVARLGGDEFGILLADIQEVETAVHVAERVLDLLAEPVSLGRNELVIAASIGIAMSTTGYQDEASMLHDADLAMYRAKSLGRARYQVCDPAMHEMAVARLRLGIELQEALAKDQFVMHYQPLVDLETGRVAGLEAMVRWRHPKRGIITPSEFIEVAQSTGLIVPLGWWVIEESCHCLSQWRRRLGVAEGLWMCVNIAAKVMMREEMIEQLTGILSRNSLPPDSLVLEFDEAVALEHGECGMKRLEELRGKEIRLCIDDFGTGYSSLSHLDQFRYDLLKIDTSIVHRLGGGGSQDQLVSTMLGLTRELGIQTVAEGVETVEQALELRRLGCRLAQGHWFARPMSPEDVEAMILEPPPWWAPGRERTAGAPTS
ncbi:MAG: EAL domain-containing protein [Thermoanaerobaculales bacterium]|nr:EAL domain-containing protein [Thermoanaerobaculales bacterium]